MLIDLSSWLSQKLVKREGEVFCLIIRNEVESRIKLPNPSITDVRDEENWIYVNPDEEGEDTDAEIEHQTRLSPPRPCAPPPLPKIVCARTMKIANGGVMDAGRFITVRRSR